MPRPQLILTMYGNKIIDQSDNAILHKSLWKTAAKTVTWILDNGEASGIAKNAGEAIKLFHEAHGVGKICGLAISPWRKIPAKKQLRSESYIGLYPARYRPGLANCDSQYNLDTRHTHYMFIDTNEENESASEIKFRGILEKHLVHWPQKETARSTGVFAHSSRQNSDRIPICGLLSGGDEQLLPVIHHTFVQNQIPFLVIDVSCLLKNDFDSTLEDWRRYLLTA
ncbi:Transient receptor putative cation channel subfamily M member 6 [Cichlidogyrus casuarinus]|uniref:Transient receptor putative cation channel subfamily M member 6 n=1 Tax=Cichlidogyrus casuarinus TaxID=1844966 RepID=A0ABD2Q370_9PLAT